MVKPYAVAVIIGEKASTKEFDTEEELQAFLKKAEELKKKAPNLQTRIIRKPKPVKEIIDDPREDSLCWKPLKRNGKRVKSGLGEYMYYCIPVPSKGKNIIYCPYCHSYKDLKPVDLGYGLQVKGCNDCGITVNDHYMKTANNLWKGFK